MMTRKSVEWQCRLSTYILSTKMPKAPTQRHCTSESLWFDERWTTITTILGPQLLLPDYNHHRFQVSTPTKAATTNYLGNTTNTANASHIKPLRRSDARAVHRISTSSELLPTRARRTNKCIIQEVPIGHMGQTVQTCHCKKHEINMSPQSVRWTILVTLLVTLLRS